MAFDLLEAEHLEHTAAHHDPVPETMGWAVQSDSSEYNFLGGKTLSGLGTLASEFSHV